MHVGWIIDEIIRHNITVIVVMSLVNFSSLEGRMDFILHILIVLNGLKSLAMISLMLDHSKISKNAFLNDPKSQKGGFWPFSRVWSVGLT